MNLDKLWNSHIQLQNSSNLPSQCCMLYWWYRSDPDEMFALTSSQSCKADGETFKYKIIEVWKTANQENFSRGDSI